MNGRSRRGSTLSHGRFLDDRSNSCGQNRDYDRAIQDYDQAIRLTTPDLAAAFNNRGVTYSQKRDYDHTIQDFDQAIRLYSRPSVIRDCRAVMSAFERSGLS